MADGAASAGREPAGFTIYRFEDGPPHQAGTMAGLTDVSRAGFASLAEAGMGLGAEARVLYEAPGFSLMYARFKSGFPLFRHSHGPDCLYQVAGGSLKIGEAELRKGDGFFLPAGTAYAFEVGLEGVEVLEFRHEPLRETVIQANNPAFWQKAVETIHARRDIWADEPRPA